MFAQEAAASTESGLLGVALLCVVVGVGVLFNFAPAAVAYARGHRSTLAITAVCLFFGWSCVGWAVALVWSLTGDTE